MPIPSDASRIHGISDEMVATEPTFAQIVDDLVEFTDGEILLIAHNNDSFDIHFMKKEFSRLGKELPDNWKFLDSLKWARRYRPDLPKHTLQYLREVFGIEANNAHRALDDVVILHKVFSLLTDDLPADMIVDLMSQKKKEGPVTRMPFGKHQGKALEAVPKHYFRWLQDQGALDKPDNAGLKAALEEKGIIKAAAATPVEAS